MTYRVELSADGALDAVIKVQAGSPEEATEKALERARSGNVVWKHGECFTDTIESWSAPEVVEGEADA